MFLNVIFNRRTKKTEALSFPKNILLKNTPKPNLRFRPDGTLKIVQLADIQDGPRMHTKTARLIDRILNHENPDLVILTGDNVSNKCKSIEAVKTAIDNIAQFMEKRKIPWATVFGNHDDEHGKLSKVEMMQIYSSYPNSLSEHGPSNIDGVGNYNILVNSSKDNTPIFNIYMLDSGTYAPKSIGGYDWIKQNQIEWYKNSSEYHKKKYNRLIPSLMFFHIPLPEWKQVWASGMAIGKKNEEECVPRYNSGLFSSLLEMGDVKGVFVGHDHTNDYMGDLNGITLGYSRSVGYATYGKRNFQRGGRVFLINEANPAQFKTWMCLE
jgi:Predicted phosphohydrolases